jgi:uncharacterized protein YlbG (UPF0298 family)
MENINKIAGPFVEAWAFETFSIVMENKDNKYQLINVQAQERLSKADVILQFKKKRKVEMLKYSILRTEFLAKKENQICPITKQPTTDVHHKKGRVGNLYLDTTHWIALSREGHKFVEENPEWAKENGYSENRISNK